jgi:hypothetical protein
LDLAYDHVPAFQIQKPRGRPKIPKQSKPYVWNSADAIKAAFKRAGMPVARSSKRQSFNSKDPLHKQHPLQVVETVEAEMDRQDDHGHGSAKRAIVALLTADAKVLGKSNFAHLKAHSRSIEVQYSTRKRRINKWRTK